MTQIESEKTNREGMARGDLLGGLQDPAMGFSIAMRVP